MESGIAMPDSIWFFNSLLVSLYLYIIKCQNGKTGNGWDNQQIKTFFQKRFLLFTHRLCCRLIE